MKTRDALKTGTVLRFEDHSDGPAAPAAFEASPAPTKRPRGLNVMRVAKIDPAKRRAAIIPIQTNMRAVRKLVGPHVGEQLVTTIADIEVRVCCETIGKGPIWRVRGSLPVRGAAVLYGFAGYGPADFPGDNAWLKRMIEFEPADIDRAINDRREEATDADRD